MALNFGESTFVRFESPGDVVGSPLSIAFQFYPDVTTPTMDNWVLRGGHTAGVYTFRLDTYPGQPAQLRFRAAYNTAPLLHITVSNSYSPGRWNHVLMTWDGTRNASGVTFYVDGSSVPSRFLSDGNGEPYDSHYYWDIGHNIPYVGLEGKLAEMGLWTRVLSADERAALAAGYSPLCLPNGIFFAPPLVRDAIDPISGQAGFSLLSMPEAFPHPPVIRPAGSLSAGRPGSGQTDRKIPWHLLVGSAV